MTQQQKMIYETLKDSDKRYNKNQAEEYLNEIISKEIEDKKSRVNSNKDTVKDYMKNSNDDDKYIYIKYPWSIGLTFLYTIFFIIIFTIGMDERRELHNIMKSFNDKAYEFTNSLNNYSNNSNNFNNYMKNISDKFYEKEELVYSELNNLGIGFIAIVILSYILFNIYSLISVFKNDFKKENNKIFWLIALIFIPISFMFYMDLEKELILDYQDNDF